VQIYIHNSRLKSFKKKTFLRKFNRPISHKRFTLNDLKKLTYAIWFFFFLIFAVRVGFVSLFTMTNMSSYKVTINSDGIKLPYSENWDRLDISSRHMAVISIHKEGYVKVEETKIDIGSLGNYIKSRRINDPRLVVSIVADKKCKMGFILKVINSMRVLPHTSFFFHTSSSLNPIGL